MKVLITGGSRGIGKGIAVELAKAGHQLLLVSKNPKTLKKTESTLRKRYRGKVTQAICDVGNEIEVEQLVANCRHNRFSPSVLVLDAGIFIEGTLTDSRTEDFQETLRVNLMHIYYLVKHFVPILRKQKAPKIIIIGSTASLEPYPVGALYGVSKWALKGYAINLRKELMNNGIAVSLINPGGTLTDLWEGEELAPDRLLAVSDIGKLIATILQLSHQAVVEELVIRPMLGDFHE